MKQPKLSVTLATYNEGANLFACLQSIKDLADEIVIVDGQSTDDTVSIAKKFHARIETRPNLPNFHINKKLANELATGEWILQMDADEVVSHDLAKEIKSLLQSSQEERNHWPIDSHNQKLFSRQQSQLEERDGQKIGTDHGDTVAFFIPRRNIFLGHPMEHTGVYPDGVIRLFQRKNARLPAKHVHEQYEVDGRVGWLNNALDHYDSPTFDRYLTRNARYASLFATQLAEQKVSLNFTSTVFYMFLKPLGIFLRLFFRHRGYKDGFPGLVFSLYSGLTWAQSYVRYWEQSRSSAK